MVNDITGAHAHLVPRADVVMRWEIDGTLDLQNVKCSTINLTPKLHGFGSIQLEIITSKIVRCIINGLYRSLTLYTNSAVFSCS